VNRISLTADDIKSTVSLFHLSRIDMKKLLPLFAILSTLLLGACDNRPIVVTPPAETVAVPGPAGPQGATGMQGTDGMQGNKGNQGNQGNDGVQGVDGTKGKEGQPGQPGEGTTVIVVPPAASASAN
jgi:hypothetical protein